MPAARPSKKNTGILVDGLVFSLVWICFCHKWPYLALPLMTLYKRRPNVTKCWMSMFEWMLSSCLIFSWTPQTLGVRGAGISLWVRKHVRSSYSSYHCGPGLRSAPGPRHHPPLTVATGTEVAFQVHAHLAVQ